MYPLTDASAHEIKVLADIVHERIQYLDGIVTLAHKYIPEGDVLTDVTRTDTQKIVVLKEWNVRLLTALQIVKDREKTLQS